VVKVRIARIDACAEIGESLSSSGVNTQDTQTQARQGDIVYKGWLMSRLGFERNVGCMYDQGVSYSND